jgi:hypothetical protein
VLAILQIFNLHDVCRILYLQPFRDFFVVRSCLSLLTRHFEDSIYFIHLYVLTLPRTMPSSLGGPAGWTPITKVETAGELHAHRILSTNSNCWAHRAAMNFEKIYTEDVVLPGTTDGAGFRAVFEEPEEEDVAEFLGLDRGVFMADTAGVTYPEKTKLRQVVYGFQHHTDFDVNYPGKYFANVAYYATEGNTCHASRLRRAIQRVWRKATSTTCTCQRKILFIMSS